MAHEKPLIPFTCRAVTVRLYTFVTYSPRQVPETYETKYLERLSDAMKLPPAGLDIGALLIGSYVNLALYSLEIIGAVIYFFGSERARRDRTLLKCAVATNVFLDTIGTFCACAINFQFIVVYWGNTDAIRKMYWPLPAWVFTHAFATLIFQSFLLHRYWGLSKNRITTAVILVLMVATLVASCYTGVESALVASGSIRAQVGFPRHAIVFLALSVATDIAIATALIWKLRHSETYSVETRKLIDRICFMAILTGCVTCIYALACLITHLLYPTSKLSTCLGFSLSRIYTLIMIVTLLYRDRLVVDPWIHSTTGGIPQHSYITADGTSAPSTPATARFKSSMPIFARNEQKENISTSPGQDVNFIHDSDRSSLDRTPSQLQLDYFSPSLPKPHHKLETYGV
ncbi:hypothetical protein B0H34DRAFT_692829 [Crassisporium funariophilum]|nr:hypothetical protein B0H34DRAFT_692829 [Crassisporium funariophilum]